MKNNRKEIIRALVMRVWNNDISAFYTLYFMTCDNIYNYCRHILKCDEKAKDSLSEVYSYALRNILHLTDPILFEPWLRRIAFDICSEKLFSQSDSMLYSMISPAKLEELPFFERQILFLSDYCDLNDKDIASVLDISKNKVASCLNSAREHLVLLNTHENIS